MYLTAFFHLGHLNFFVVFLKHFKVGQLNLKIFKQITWKTFSTLPWLGSPP